MSKNIKARGHKIEFNYFSLLISFSFPSYPKQGLGSSYEVSIIMYMGNYEK